MQCARLKVASVLGPSSPKGDSEALADLWRCVEIEMLAPGSANLKSESHTGHHTHGNRCPLHVGSKLWFLLGS